MTGPAERALGDALAFAESIVDTIRDPLLVLDDGLRVVTAGREFYRAFGVTPEETTGRLVYDLGNRQWDIPGLRTLLEEILPRSTTFRDFEVEHTFEQIGRRVMLLNARTLHREQHDTRRILLIIEDVTEQRDAERARHAAEVRFTEMVRNVRDHSIFLTDPDGVITSWNVAAERVIGYAEAEAVGRHYSLIFTPEDRHNGLPEWELRTAREQGRAEDERWHLRKDGGRFWALGIVTPLRDPDGRLTGFSKILRDITDRKRMEGELRDAKDRLEERTAALGGALQSLEAEMVQRRDLARRLSTVQEDERKRVARDLHDSVGQLLAGLSLALRAVEASGDLPAPAAARLAEVQRVADLLGKEVHALAVRLRPTSLDDLGLEAALGQLVAEWSARTAVRADLHAGGLSGGRLPAEVETTVYRIVQEALTNVARHARATQASVALTVLDGTVTVAVDDDGAGFDPEAGPRGRLGLMGMRERAAQAGGELDVESRPGAGTTVVARIPLGGAGP